MASNVRTLGASKKRSSKPNSDEPQKGLGWTFLTNHSHVLLCLYRAPDQRLRDVATAVGITERMVQRIVVELVEAGYLNVSKAGRRNHYVINSKLQLRHALGTHHTIGDLLKAIS